MTKRASHRITALMAGLVIAATLAGLGACVGRPAGLAEQPAEPLPDYETIYEASERRIGTLDRLWAAAVTSLRYVDAEGERHRDQGEGHFQVVRPGSLALFVGKLGETYLVLGSDDTRYWWLELLEGGVAYVGDKADAPEAATDVLGVPVLPADLLLALDLQRWPEPGDASVRGVTRSSLDGLDPSRTAAVSFETGGRIRRVHVDVFTLEPLAVELATPDGEVFALSRLSQHGRVLNRIGAHTEPRIPMRAEIDLPAADARLELTLSRAELSSRRPRAIAFDLEGLLDRFRVKNVIQIEPGGTQTSATTEASPR